MPQADVPITSILASELWDAAFHGRDDVIRALVKRRADPNLSRRDGKTPLCIAALNGHEATIRTLVELRADPNTANRDGDTPIMLSSDYGHTQAVRVLVELRASVNTFVSDHSRSPIWRALRSQDAAMIDVLADLGADVNSKHVHQTMLHTASSQGLEDVVRTLLKHRANPSIANDSGASALHCAAMSGDKQIVRALIDRRADPHAQDCAGDTPLAYAAMRGHEAIVRALIELRGDTNQAGNDGSTPLMWAVVHDHVSTVRTLVALSANVNAPNNEGSTPIYMASQFGFEHMIHAIVAMGGNPSTLHRNGFTPRVAALRFGHEKVGQSLKILGAEFGHGRCDAKDVADAVFLSPLRRFVLGMRLHFPVPVLSLVDSSIFSLLSAFLNGRIPSPLGRMLSRLPDSLAAHARQIWEDRALVISVRNAIADEKASSKKNANMHDPA